MSKATPRPWYCDGHANEWEIFSEADWPIARMNAKIEAGPQANAALIVKAVNAYDGMVRALREIDMLARSQLPATSWRDCADAASSRLARIRQISEPLLAKAEGAAR